MNVGKSILDILWEELDSIVDRIMDDGEPDIDKYDSSSGGNYVPPDYDIGALGTAFREWGEERGKAQGVAYAIALLTNPLAPDAPAVRELAMQRWQERQWAAEDGAPEPEQASPGRLVHTPLTAQQRRDQAERDVT